MINYIFQIPFIYSLTLLLEMSEPVATSSSSKENGIKKSKTNIPHTEANLSPGQDQAQKKTSTKSQENNSNVMQAEKVNVDGVPSNIVSTRKDCPQEEIHGKGKNKSKPLLSTNAINNKPQDHHPSKPNILQTVLVN